MTILITKLNSKKDKGKGILSSASSLLVSNWLLTDSKLFISSMFCTDRVCHNAEIFFTHFCSGQNHNRFC
jgi:hypothetical protein